MSDDPVTEAEAKKALGKILESDVFQGKNLRSDFLAFVVKERFGGRSDRIKGTTIAIEVYGRSADFDPQSDPIVRVEARKLRRDLDYYYLTEGAQDELRIEIPKGGYVPVISRVEQHPETEPFAQIQSDHDTNDPTGKDTTVVGGVTKAFPRWGWPGLATIAAVLLALVFGLSRNLTEPEIGADTSISGPTLFVLPFGSASALPDETVLARGVTIETTNALTKFAGLKVYPVGPAYPIETATSHPDNLHFILSGDVQLAGAEVRITAQLQQAKDGQLVWSERYAGSMVPDQVFRIQAEIAESVAKQLAEPFGILGDLSRQGIASGKNPSMNSYQCVLRAYEYRATFSREQHGAARDCLEKAVRSDPEYSRAWALLAYVIADEYRFFYNQRPGAYTRALEAGRTAVDLSPNDALSHQALSVALFGNGEIEAALEAGRKAVELNPYNTEALIQVGYRTFATGRWEEGVALVEEAIAKSPSPPQWYPWVLALYHYNKQDFERARELAEEAGLPGFVIFEATRTAIYGQLGMTEEASRSLDLVRRLDPEFNNRARQWFYVHHFPEDFLDAMMDGIEKAGLETGVNH